MVIYMEGNLDSMYAKMGYGVMRYSENQIVCVIDSDFAGKKVNQVIDQVAGEEERIKTIFLVVLNRIPDGKEMALCLDLVNGAKDKRATYRNIVAGLIASQEFYFIF